jgi:hypothetical protein
MNPDADRISGVPQFQKSMTSSKYHKRHPPPEGTVKRERPMGMPHQPPPPPIPNGAALSEEHKDSALGLEESKSNNQSASAKDK